VVAKSKQYAALILRQLTHRLGTLPAPLVSRIEQLSLERLETLSLDWLNFQNLADLELWTFE
jgi:hypothetical protein